MIRQRFARFAAVGACVIGAATFAVSPAMANRQWLNSSPINSGESVFTHYNTTRVYGKSVGSAAACAGMRGIGDICGGEGQLVYSPISEIGDEGYLHDHSTWKSWFNAWSEP